MSRRVPCLVYATEQVSTVSVEIFLMGNPETSSSTSGDFATYGSGVSLVPLIIILLLASTTQMVELSLFLGIWLGACILTGSLAAGFKSTILDYLILELADEGHVMVIVFTVFLSGLVGMLVRACNLLFSTKAGNVAIVAIVTIVTRELVFCFSHHFMYLFCYVFVCSKNQVVCLDLPTPFPRLPRPQEPLSLRACSLVS